MKKLVAFVLALCLLAASTAAMAEAKLTVVQNRLVTMEGEYAGYFYAKIENTGDEAGYVDMSGKLVGFDADDNLVFVENYVHSIPHGLLLEPGEYAYAYGSIFDEALKTTTVTDYEFSLKFGDYGHKFERIPCEATFSIDEEELDNSFVDIIITNNTDEMIYQFQAVAALYDANDELIYLAGDTNFRFVIHPGSTVTMRLPINDRMIQYFKDNSLVPTTVDAMIYPGRYL